MIYRAITLVALFAIPLFYVPTAGADIIKYLDENGTVHFTDRLVSRPYEVFKRSAQSSRRFAALKRVRYTPIIRQAGTKHGVDPELIRSVIEVESGFDSRAVSHAGARGLMQLMPPTAARYNVRNSFSPDDNINGGTRYLKYLLGRYDGNLKLALAAYNAGENAVDKYSGVPPYRETKRYIEKVLSLYYKTPGNKNPIMKKPRIYRYFDENGTLVISDVPKTAVQFK